MGSGLGQNLGHFGQPGRPQPKLFVIWAELDQANLPGSWAKSAEGGTSVGWDHHFEVKIHSWVLSTY